MLRISFCNSLISFLNYVYYHFIIRSVFIFIFILYFSLFSFLFTFKFSLSFLFLFIYFFLSSLLFFIHYIFIFFLGSTLWTVNELAKALIEIYCGNVGAEYLHIENEQQRNWLKNKIEGNLI